MMHQNYDIIYYIDDFLRFGTRMIAKGSFDTLYDTMQKLGLLSDTDTVFISPEKLGHVKDMVSTRSTKSTA